MNEQDIELKGKGGFHTPDPRDYQDTCHVAGAPEPFDWNTGVQFTLPFVINDQNGSESCVGQMTEEGDEILSGFLNKRSARYVYCQKFLPQGGMYVRDGLDILCNQSIEFEAGFSSQPEIEAHMRDTTNINISKYDIPGTYAAVPLDIDSVAAAVRDHKWVALAVWGDNAGWTQADVIPPKSANWGHAISIVGAEMRNGKKVLKFINHWGNWGDQGYGYLSEDYFLSGNIQCAYVITNNFSIPMQILTEKEVQQLYALWGISDPAGVAYWTGKTLDELLTARLADQIKTLQGVE